MTAPPKPTQESRTVDVRLVALTRAPCERAVSDPLCDPPLAYLLPSRAHSGLCEFLLRRKHATLASSFPLEQCRRAPVRGWPRLVTGSRGSDRSPPKVAKGGPGSRSASRQQTPPSAGVHLARPLYVPMTDDEHRGAVRAVAQLLAARRRLDPGLDLGPHVEVTSAGQQGATAAKEEEWPST